MRPSVAAFALVCLLPAAAAAHGVIPGLAPFQAGAASLIVSPLACLCWLGLGAVAALQPEARAGWVAESFALGLACGALGVVACHQSAPPAWADALALLTIGGSLVFGRRVPALLLYPLAAAVAFAQGWHDGADAEGAMSLLPFVAGLSLAGYAFAASAIAGAVVFAKAGEGSVAGWRLIALRSFGSWLTAIALMSGGFALRSL